MELKRIPMCVKCASAITEPFENATVKAKTLVGCKEDPRIKNWQDAQEMCPLLGKDKSDV